VNRLKEIYNNEIAGKMQEKFGYKNVMQIPKIDKNCPTLSAVMHNEDKDKVYEIELGKNHPDEEKIHGFALNIEVNGELPLISSINKNVMDAAYTLVNKNLKMYNELFKTPPFPARKDGLKDLWN